jgi:hypothetical protein
MDNKVSFHFIGDSHTWIFLEKMPETIDSLLGIDKKQYAALRMKYTYLFFDRAENICKKRGDLLKNLDPHNQFMAFYEAVNELFSEHDVPLVELSQNKLVTQKDFSDATLKLYKPEENFMKFLDSYATSPSEPKLVPTDMCAYDITSEFASKYLDILIEPKDSVKNIYSIVKRWCKTLYTVFPSLDDLSSNIIPLNNEITLFSWRYPGIDGALAYQISKRSEIIDCVVNNYVKKDTDYLCFMTGEIDCRFKINTYAKKTGVSVKEMSISVARKYIDFIYEKYQGYNIIIWGPHAQNNDPSYEYTDGTMEERNIATFHFNNELLRLCNEHNWIYISLFDTMIGSDMKTHDIEKWFLDGVHVNPELAKPFLIKQLFFQLKDKNDNPMFSDTYKPMII